MDLKSERAVNSQEQLWAKGNVSDDDFMIHVLNNFPKKYDIILDGLENCLTSSGDDALMIQVIREKLNHRYKKIRIEIKKKEKSRPWEPTTSNLRCCKCGKYSHKPNDLKCPEN